MYIYLITDSSQIKVGVSRNPSRRLKQLQTGCAERLTLMKSYKVSEKIAKKLEHQIHRMFWQRRSRYNGEWFDLTQDHLDVLEEWLNNYTQSQTPNL